jgi:PAS domain S-box-containing protein/putative nucleotidyltransferase with HDIG domain
MINNHLNACLGKIMVVDDEAELMRALTEMLAKQGYESTGFTRGPEALDALKEKEFDLVLTDLMMPEMDGIDLLKAGFEVDPHLVGIIMTGQGTVQTAVGAMKTGAFDYILKPFKMGELLPVLSRAMEFRHLRKENMQLRETVAIHELCNAIAYTTDLREILNTIVDTALQQCDADEASIMLPTHNGKELYVAAVRGDYTEHLGLRVPIETGIAGWVATNHQPLALVGEVDDPRFKPVNPRNSIRASVSMPMMVGGNLVGVLNINITRSRRSFTPGKLKALSILVSIVAPVLENTQLYIQLREAEEKYRSIFENAVEGIYQSLPDGRLITANPALADMLGYNSPEDLLATVPDMDRIHVDGNRRSEFNGQMEAQSIVKYFESQVYCKDGSIIWVMENARVVHHSSGAMLCYEGSVHDVTDRKLAEENFFRERSMVDRIMKTSPAGITVVDRKGHLTFANARAEQIFGMDAQKIRQHTYHSDAWKMVDFDGNPLSRDQQPFMQVRSTGKPVYGVRHALKKPDGGMIYLSINCGPFFDESGRIDGVVFTVDDITEQKHAEESLSQSYRKLKKTLDDMIRAMSIIVETRDPYTAGHQLRVANLAAAIAGTMGLSEEQSYGIKMAAIIHDIGKIYVPAEILSKPTALNPIEFDMIKQHADIGHQILRTIEFPYPVAEIVRQHHERLDGSGYPQGIRGNEILLEAKILAVSDVVEAMASHRPYRPALGLEKALEEISRNKGRFYDVQVVEACQKLFFEMGYELDGAALTSGSPSVPPATAL